MTEDKQAIEAIAKALAKEWNHEDLGEATIKDNARELLQTLASLGYVKLAEQKLPENETIIIQDASFDSFLQRGYKIAQQDMLSVDSEGCAYRRVKVK